MPPGAQGSKGERGVAGPQGSQGAQGATGPQGAKKSEGGFGGVTLNYKFSSATNSSIDNGEVAFDNTTLSSISLMTVSESDKAGTNVESYLRTIDDSTASIKVM